MANKLTAPSGSALGGNLSPDALIECVMEDARLKRAVDEANGKFRANRSKMEKQGVNLKVLADLTRLSKLDDDERLAHLKTMFRYATILDLKVGDQTELFPETLKAEKVGEKTTQKKQLWAAEEAGYQVGLNGGDEKQNPYEAGSPNFQAWDKGLRGGRDFLAGKAQINPTTGKKAKVGKVEQVSARRGSGRRGGKGADAKPNTPATGHA